MDDFTFTKVKFEHSIFIITVLLKCIPKAVSHLLLPCHEHTH